VCLGKRILGEFEVERLGEEGKQEGGWSSRFTKHPSFGPDAFPLRPHLVALLRKVGEEKEEGGEGEGCRACSSAGTDTSPGVSNKYQRQPAEYQIIIK